MEEKPFFEINNWLDLLTYISVVLMPLFFILTLLCSDSANVSENTKDYIIVYFIICYIPIYSPGKGLIVKGLATLMIWLFGAVAIYLVFPLWVYPIYVICPILWYIRYSREKKHER